MDILITGPRKLDTASHAAAHYRLWEIWREHEGAQWRVGCAAGVDAIARETCDPEQLILFEAASRKPWELQARSKRMVDSANSNAILFAFPNKPCPAGITLNKWCGSGTWGTMFYAHSKGIKIEIFWLCDPQPLPEWMAIAQKSLF